MVAYRHRIGFYRFMAASSLRCPAGWRVGGRLLALLFLLAAASGTMAEVGTPPKDPRQLKGVERITVVKGGGYFPILIRLNNGTLAAVVRGGARHVGVGGRLDLVTSRDGGRNWSAPRTIVYMPPDSRSGAFGQAPDGRLIYAFSVTGPYRRGQFVFETNRYTLWVTTSEDDGDSWMPPQRINTAPYQYAMPYGKIVALPDGILLMALYGWYQPEREGGELPPEKRDKWMAAVCRSEDNGATWSLPIPIVGYIPGRRESTSYSEVALVVLPGGKVLAAMRGGPLDGLDQCISSDGGRTWGPIESIMCGLQRQPGDVILLKSGRLLLTVGHREPPFGVEAVLSRKNPGQWDQLAGATPVEPRPAMPARSGEQWDWQTHLSLEWNAASADCGYPSSVQLDDGTIVTLYYGVGELGKPAEFSPIEPEHRLPMEYAKCVRYRESDLLGVTTPVGLLGATTADEDPPARLVAHYPLDEGSGDVVREATGEADPGRVHGAKWVEYGWGRVLAFDGKDDFVACGSPKALDLRGPMSMSVWVWPDEVPQGEVGIAGKRFSSYLMTFYSNQVAYWYVGEGTNNARVGLPSGTWSHLVGVFDGQTMTLYLNGKLVSQGPSKSTSVPPGKDFSIGCVKGDPDSGDGHFRGKIAEVKVYSGALSADEVEKEFMAAGKERFGAGRVEIAPVKGVASIEREGIRLSAGAGGALQVDTPQGFFLVESSFSYPGDVIGHSRFAGDLKGSESAWRPEVKPVGQDGLAISAKGRFYSVSRSARIRDGRVEFSDTITNLAAEPVGILVRHRIVTPSTFSNSRLGNGADEPIVFLSLPEYDLGLAIEDDVGRHQFEAHAVQNQAGVQFAHFGLDAGKSHTFQWAIYPLEPSGDEFVFVNRLREDWGVNQTILGPCSFFPIDWNLLDDPARLRQYLDRKDLKVVMTSTWLDYDPGSLSHTPSREEYKTLMRKAMKALKAAAPEIKVLGSIECDWAGIFPDRIPNGERLPSHKGGAVRTVRTTPEQTKIIMDSDLPWKDSVRMDRDGSLVLELYARGGKPQIALAVYPAPGNYQAQYLMEQARFLCEEAGLDGFYIDEFSRYWIRSWDKWDGWTVDLDPKTGRILRKYTDQSLAGNQPRLDLCNYCVKNQYTMVANTWATTLAEARLPVLRFYETWSRFDPHAIPKTGKPPFIPALGRSQLGTMIGLGVDGRELPRGDAELLIRSLILFLRHGMVYYHYYFPDLPQEGEGSGEYGPINHAFPITPVRLFEGGIEGRERTVTCVSATYTWPHAAKPSVLAFDKAGREKPSHAQLTRTDKGWSVELKLDDWNEIAVIEE